MAKTPTVHVNLRLPPDLHKLLVETAAAQYPPISLNRSIINLLKSALLSSDERIEDVRAEWQELSPRQRDERIKATLNAFLQAMDKDVVAGKKGTAKKKGAA